MVFVSGRTPVGTWPKWTGCWDSTETIQMIKLKPWPWSDTWSISICFTSYQCKMIGIHLHILWWFDVTFHGTKFASRLFTWWKTPLPLICLGLFSAPLFLCCTLCFVYSGYFVCLSSVCLSTPAQGEPGGVDHSASDTAAEQNQWCPECFSFGLHSAHQRPGSLLRIRCGETDVFLF